MFQVDQNCPCSSLVPWCIHQVVFLLIKFFSSFIAFDGLFCTTFNFQIINTAPLHNLELTFDKICHESGFVRLGHGKPGKSWNYKFHFAGQESHEIQLWFMEIKRQRQGMLKSNRQIRKPDFIPVTKLTLAPSLCIIMWENILTKRLF